LESSREPHSLVVSVLGFLGVVVFGVGGGLWVGGWGWGWGGFFGVGVRVDYGGSGEKRCNSKPTLPIQPPVSLEDNDGGRKLCKHMGKGRKKNRIVVNKRPGKSPHLLTK